ncbi:helix-turn-helix transcriptional regulator [Streptomyces sp. ID05-04B]|uniref:helix-turn-helix domain-containing protein n=1 Tax=Streptomyces sp. ID05-04B TaxID=3028661 RepID=UPI0029C13A2B|nr:helix-turn-helix transcriptional regulator [Streptomyces sp. ID05-04B]MDX5570203.1 helix-turn-helix transcriptional regulator [Streptomyces sp. ID05-04B]
MSGRPLDPLPATAGPALVKLTEWLRMHKEASGKSGRELAQDSGAGISERTLLRAFAGRCVPSEAVVEDLAEILHADKAVARRLWRGARAETAVGPGMRRRGPATVTTAEALVEAMIVMRAQAGQPALAHLEETAGRDETGRWRLPHSTLWLVLQEKIPPSEGLFTAFLHALYLPGKDVREWQATFRRVYAGAPVRRAWGEPPPPVVRNDPAPLTSCENGDVALQRMERHEEIKLRTGQVREPDDYELLGLGSLNSPGPEAYDEETLAQWEAESTAAHPEQHGGTTSLKDELRAILDRARRA